MKSLELKRRSLFKALSYRVLGSAATALIAYILTKKLALSLAAGAMDSVFKILLFYFHERVWAKIRWGRTPNSSGIILITGLSGAGKSALAEMLCAVLKSNGVTHELLDGDVVRNLFKDIGFSREERVRHLSLMAFMASELERQGTLVVCTFIAPYEETRKKFRDSAKKYTEIWIDTPLKVCEARDPKGLYAKARRGEIQHFTGVSDTFEAPHNADIRIDTSGNTPNESFRQLLEEIKKHNPDLAYLKIKKD